MLVCDALKGPNATAGGKELEVGATRVGKVSNNLTGLAQSALGVDGGQGLQLEAHDPASSAHDTLQLVFLLLGGTSKPHTDGEGEDTFHHSTVEL